MPSIKKGESEKDYVARCIPIVMKEKKISAKEAAARCHGMYKQHKKKGTQYADKYEPPEAGDAPKAVKDILKKSYANCRKTYPKYSKERCSKIAWGAVKNAGWHKDTKGKWVKSKSKNSDDYLENIVYPFTFQCDSFEFMSEDDEEEVYRMTIAIANRFMKQIYMAKDEFKQHYKEFENTMHDINHQGTGYIAGFSVVPSQIEYVVGYQDNIQYNELTGEITGDVHIVKRSIKYGAWKNYVEICKKIGRTPNVSMFVNGKVEYKEARELPEDSHYRKNGYLAKDLVPCLINMQPVAVSTVFKGACNDKDGCGINYDCNDGTCNVEDEDDTSSIEADDENKEYKDYLEKRLKNLKKGD